MKNLREEVKSKYQLALSIELKRVNRFANKWQPRLLRKIKRRIENRDYIAISDSLIQMSFLLPIFLFVSDTAISKLIGKLNLQFGEDFWIDSYELMYPGILLFRFRVL